MADTDGDMYDHIDEFPPPYAQCHVQQDIVVPQSEPVALTISDRTSVGRIVVATVIIFVTWVTMQVIQRTLGQSLA